MPIVNQFKRLLRLSKQKRKRPEDVFTPRAADFDLTMYVERPELEKAFKLGLGRTFHLAMHGESGGGKSWLYKKVMSDLGGHYEVVNLAIAARDGSIKSELENFISRTEPARKSGYRVGRQAEVGALGTSGGFTTETDYTISRKEPFELALKQCRVRAKTALAVLVFENFEEIIDKPDLLKELASLIKLIDDQNYAQYEVKILVVGAGTNFLSHYTSNANFKTLTNRIKELPEVSRLTAQQCRTLIERGLVSELGLEIPDQESVVNHIFDVTGRVPQHVHEYCIELAHLALENSTTITSDLLPKADQRWHSQPLQIEPALETIALGETNPEESVPFSLPESMPPSTYQPINANSHHRLVRGLARIALGCALAAVSAALIVYALACIYFRFIF